VSGTTIRIGTRASRLALWQANHVAASLALASPRHRFELVTFQTAGDRIGDVALPRIGDRGLFTRDIETALREGAIDVAVHSLKDLPTSGPPDLVLGAVLEREDPRDALVTVAGAPLAALPPGARIGTSSLRRRVQLLALRRDLTIVDIRGNVPTRLEKVARGRDYEGTLLALAGLRRLGAEDRAAEVFAADAVLPAPGQGALAVQVRAADEPTMALVAPIDHAPTRLATSSERTVLGTLRGGCQAPLGALARWTDGQLHVAAVVGAVDGARMLRSQRRGPATDPAEAAALGEQVAEDLRRQGAADLLAAARAWIEAEAPAGGTA
jgi:hydroxymethylbilane synthase